MSQSLSSNHSSTRKIGIVVGEASGDILGAGLMKSLQKYYPQAEFVGIGGPKMIELGFNSLFPQDRLAVMGLIEPLKRLPELLSIRRQLIKYFIKNKPSLVIGIDAPDFNLGLELSVRQAGITTAHYVSPSVWAWRQGRIKKIAKAVDLMLTLLPFEADFYQQHRVPVKFVGHPLADDIDMVNRQDDALRELNLPPKKDGEYIVALLPGSRSMEVERLGDVFLQTATLLAQQFDQIRFVIPAANAKRYEQLEALVKKHALQGSIELLEGQSCRAMQAADTVLMASGTTTLEALLIKRPMVIAYIVSPMTYLIVKWMVKVAYIGLPNLLAGRKLVPEFIQHQATPETLSGAVADWLRADASRLCATEEAFGVIHQQLKKNASETAAGALAQLIEAKHGS